MTNSKGVRPLTAKQSERLEKIKQKTEEERTPTEIKSLLHLENKLLRFNDPPISKTAQLYLTNRYAWEKYAKKLLSKSENLRSLEKGSTMEAEAIKLLAEFDKQDYCKSVDVRSNQYLIGVSDIVSYETGKIIDVKASWNLSSFLKILNYPLDIKYWYQMQGYLELYDLEVAEVCYVLLNTPEDLVSREKIKLLNRFIAGEVSREEYDAQYESLGMALNYDNIPLKRRIIRYIVHRDRDFLPSLYAKIEKCRVWLSEFERLHNASKNIVSLKEYYVKTAQENNTESDPDDAYQSDTGG